MFVFYKVILIISVVLMYLDDTLLIWSCVGIKFFILLYFLLIKCIELKTLYLLSALHKLHNREK